jgi:hypothetical protein
MLKLESESQLLVPMPSESNCLLSSVSRSSLKQKNNSRVVFVKRARLYHSGRVYMHALYRYRSEIDDKLLVELVELSLSPYTRVRRYVVVHHLCLVLHH